MKILMTADTVGGVWTYAVELVRSLASSSVQFFVATMGEKLSASQRDEIQSLTNATIYESTWKLEWMEEPWADVTLAGDWLLSLEREVRPDLVHLNGYAHAALPWRGPALVVGHSCVYSWFEAVRHDTPPASWQTYRHAVERGLHAASLVVTPSNSMLAALRRHYKFETPSRVIYNARDPQRFRTAPKEPFILTAGRLWDRAKNAEMVCRIAGRLNWPVYLAGDAQDGLAFDSDNVHLLGRLPQDELASWYSRAAICVLPARYEPFGLTAVEAALSGCALVLGDIDSLRELWDGAANFVNPNDGEGLIATVETLISNPRLRETMATRAQQRALTFAPERMAREYFDVYTRLIRPESRVPGPRVEQPRDPGPGTRDPIQASR